MRYFVATFFDPERFKSSLRNVDKTTEEATRHSEALKYTLAQLRFYPEWRGYVYSQLAPALYNLEGDSIRPDRPAASFPLSYMMWWEERGAGQIRLLRAKDVFRQQAIAEAFPQQLKGSTTKETVENMGNSSTRRRWEIRTRPPR